jgi:hypothetical protein
MKASLHAMVSRGWIYSEFYSGLKESLDEESGRSNMAVEYISDFSQRVGVDFNVIYPLISERRWSDFVDTLIRLVPRRGDTGRYNQ